MVPQLELKKMLLDRMVHLLSRGSAIPVVTYVRKCSEQQDTDISLIRHFVTEVGESLLLLGTGLVGWSFHWMVANLSTLA